MRQRTLQVHNKTPRRGKRVETIRIFDTKRDLEAIKQLLDRRNLLSAGNDELLEKVRAILRRVRQAGDQALLDYTLEFDQVQLSNSDLKVKQEEIEAAYCLVDQEFLSALRIAKANILAFHQRQKRETWLTFGEQGVLLGQRYLPLGAAGLYVPGGTGGQTPLVSSVLMNALPAKVAGVPRLVVCTPPRSDRTINPFLLVAAAEAGVTELYKVGGAQAIAALAYGTETIAPVDKIVGPGNLYVTMAKRLVYGEVGLDMLAGPSEILIIADGSADPALVAADLLSQAEHGPVDEAGAILLTTSAPLIEAVRSELEKQLADLPRAAIAWASLQRSGGLILVRDLDEAVELANFAAPEHLELLIDSPYEWLGKIKNAGAVFLGPYSPEPLGDYVAGTNHVLPTNGTARFASALSVDDFMKTISLVGYNQAGLKEHGAAAVTLARVEGLEAHARAVEIRNNE
ncbi:MAG: histidinol dehydrogenase [Firmicutes bacterium]|nr:histidinol dehydrogenase [Bacillota bacterium]